MKEGYVHIHNNTNKYKLLKACTNEALKNPIQDEVNFTKLQKIKLPLKTRIGRMVDIFQTHSFRSQSSRLTNAGNRTIPPFYVWNEINPGTVATD